MKKGSFNLAMEMPLWVLRIGILILILLVIVSGVSIFLTREIDVNKYESQLIMYNIYNCLSYDNHFGMIDSTKLNNLDKCFNFGNIKLNLTLRNLEDNSVRDRYIDHDGYKLNYPLCKIKTENELMTCYITKDYVIMDNKPTLLEFSLVFPKNFEVNK
ncbi:MAG: hypothetical protein PHF86_09145 [Candidatus Nanoarchaeia archaeon]|nr:hypothetical protein [Candidatus Nanoarchaeia archaeon]